jgi:hypothetical protein
MFGGKRQTVCVIFLSAFVPPAGGSMHREIRLVRFERKAFHLGRRKQLRSSLRVNLKDIVLTPHGYVNYQYFR